MLGCHEPKVGADPSILLQVVLVGVILGSVHQLEPGISKVRVEQGMVGGVLLDDRAVGLVRDERDVRGQAHGLGKLAGLVAGVPLVIAIPGFTAHGDAAHARLSGPFLNWCLQVFQACIHIYRYIHMHHTYLYTCMHACIHTI